MVERLLSVLPVWLHPRFPLVANELRHYSAIDRRILQLNARLPNLLALLYLMLVVSAGLALLGIGELLGYLLMAALFLVVPAVVILSEVLLSRAIFSIPARSGQMIAGETRRGTWEPILSTPLPRYQVLLSKYAALYWNAEPVLTPIIVMRINIIAFLIIERQIFSHLSPGTLLGFALVGLAIALTPLVDLLALGSLGILMSAQTSSPQRAVFLTWSAWGLMRAGIALAMVLTLVSPGSAIVTNWILAAIWPHWLLVVYWFVAINTDLGLIFYGTYLGLYLGLPLMIGLLSLAWTLRRLLE